ncbi:hypothetical protein C8F01DRAFT_1332973 [Mycena amicta]|nr:hypothetical protein C8F01DRAFT_1332973 [Mycena amicta]
MAIENAEYPAVKEQVESAEGEEKKESGGLSVDPPTVSRVLDPGHLFRTTFRVKATSEEMLLRLTTYTTVSALYNPNPTPELGHRYRKWLASIAPTDPTASAKSSVSYNEPPSLRLPRAHPTPASSLPVDSTLPRSIKVQSPHSYIQAICTDATAEGSDDEGVLSEPLGRRSRLEALDQSMDDPEYIVVIRVLRGTPPAVLGYPCCSPASLNRPAKNPWHVSSHRPSDSRTRSMRRTNGGDGRKRAVDGKGALTAKEMKRV